MSAMIPPTIFRLHRMMTLARIYGFWKYVTNLERAETQRYLEMLYGLQYRRLAESVPH